MPFSFAKSDTLSDEELELKGMEEKKKLEKLN